MFRCGYISKNIYLAAGCRRLQKLRLSIMKYRTDAVYIFIGFINYDKQINTIKTIQ